jgi:hypothetical protein
MQHQNANLRNTLQIILRICSSKQVIMRRFAGPAARQRVLGSHLIVKGPRHVTHMQHQGVKLRDTLQNILRISKSKAAYDTCCGRSCRLAQGAGITPEHNWTTPTNATSEWETMQFLLLSLRV